MKNFANFEGIPSTSGRTHNPPEQQHDRHRVNTKKASNLNLKKANSHLRKQLMISRIVIIGISIILAMTCVFYSAKFSALSAECEDLYIKYAAIINTLESSTSDPVSDNQSTDRFPFVQTNMLDQLDVQMETPETQPQLETQPQEDMDKIPAMYKYIPLDDELKEYIYTSAIEANIPPEVLFSIAWKESSFNPSASSNTNDHGLFQINKTNFKYLAKMYGYTYDDFCEKVYDPYVNTDCAIVILTECRDNYNNDNWHHVLMRYNMGPSRTNELFKEGIYSSKYSRAILSYADETFGFDNVELG